MTTPGVNRIGADGVASSSEPSGSLREAIARESPPDAERRRLEQVVRELQQGIDQEHNFEHLFERYFRLVFRFFREKSLPPDTSQDLSQETFLRVYRGLGSYRFEARFEGWLLKIAENVHREAWRRRSTAKRSGQEVSLELPPGDPDSPSAERQLPAASPGPLEHLLRQEHGLALREAIFDLPPQMRRCVLLRTLHGLPVREIAELLQLSTQTVKVHLFRARRRLRKVGGAFDHDLL